MEGDLAAAHVLQDIGADLDALADDAFQQHFARADQFRREQQARVRL